MLRTTATLARHAAVDLFYVADAATADFDSTLVPANVRLFPTLHPSPGRAKVLRHTLFHREHLFLLNAALATGVRYSLVYANDLPCLPAGASAARRLRCRLAYDAHEIYTETLNQFLPVAAPGSRGFVARALVRAMGLVGRRVEQRLAPRVDTFITVNAPLAAYFRAQCGVEAVHVVMNCPVYQEPRAAPSIDFRARFAWRPETSVFIYQGMLNQGRGLDRMMAAVALADPRIRLVVLGGGVLRSQLDTWLVQLGVGDRVRLLEPVPPGDLPGYTAAADCGISLLDHYNLSKQLATPNKLFEYMHAGVPAVCSDTPGQSEIVQTWRTGLLTNNEPSEIAARMQELTAGWRQPDVRERLRHAAGHFSWQRQEGVLESALGLDVLSRS